MPRWQLSERNARFRKRRNAGFPVVVSEGDSWFDYPFYLNTIDLIDDQELFAHLRLEASGDTVRNMIGTDDAIANLRTVVEDERPLFVLFSGGGNDLSAEAARLFREADDPEDCLVPEVSVALFDYLEDRYDAMIRALGPTAPVVGHGYDYFPPSDAPVLINLVVDIPITGPWIFPALIQAGLGGPSKERLRRQVARVLVDRFNERLEALQERHPLDFIYVDLRGTLRVTKDWENEIHPTVEGFRRVADRLLAQLRRRFPDVLKKRLQERMVANG